MDPTTDDVLLDIVDHVAHITLNRPASGKCTHSGDDVLVQRNLATHR